MRASIREEMGRYPVFSCSNVDSYIDESDLFRDEEIKKYARSNAPFQKKNQTIISIYDRINSNNTNDPLYPQPKQIKDQSLVTTARHSQKQPKQGKKQNNSTITKFVGELAKSLTKEDPSCSESQSNLNRSQKISLLKRIIDHYNIKHVERKYYSNLIKTYGLRIQSVNSNEIAVKKNLHPRSTVKSFASPREEGDGEESPDLRSSNLEALTTKKSIGQRKFRPSYSFMSTKEKIDRSTHNLIQTSQKKRMTIHAQRDRQSINEHSPGRLRHSRQGSSKRFVQKPLKMQNSTNSIESKLKKYREFLFLVNLSNGFYRELEVEKYANPFKIFIGRGNNRNLIKSIMNKRFWFEETNNPAEANFIWTQLKIETMFVKQVSAIRSDQEYTIEVDLLDSFPSEEIKLDCSDKTEAQKVEPRKIEKQSIRVRNSDKCIYKTKYSRFIGKARDYAPSDPILKILAPADLPSYKTSLDLFSLKKNSTFADRARLYCGLTMDESSDLVVQNHLPFNGLLGNKKAMYYNLKEYCRLTKKDLSEYVPLTYHIKKGLLDPQYKAMASKFTDQKKAKRPNYWIMKPGQFSNRGQGITCANKLEDIRARVMKCKDSKRSTPSCSMSKRPSSIIVQQYISNPLLYYSRKFDIRVFMMVTITNGKLKGYWYQEGYVRTSSFMWNLQDMDDKYIHLTNDAIQKTCDEYGLYEAGNKLTFQDLQRYLSTLPSNGRNLNFFDVIYPHMRKIAGDLIRSTFVNLDPKRLRDNFEIFGLDFMIDETFRPWLIEVNTNPCLELACPILERIIPHMLENAFRIAVDPLFPPPTTLTTDYKYAIPENALHYNKFELIFDEDEEGKPLRALYKDNKILEEIEEYEEDKQQFEEEGEMMELSNS